MTQQLVPGAMTVVHLFFGATSVLASPRPNTSAERIASPAMMPTTRIAMPSLYGSASLVAR